MGGAVMVKPGRKIGARVRWLPRADHRTGDRYDPTQLKLLADIPEWSIWADAPEPSWVWLVAYPEGRTVTTKAALDDLDLVIR